jgi:phage pi2 protein 07
MCLIVPYYYETLRMKEIVLWKFKGLFKKVVSLNEVIKHILCKPNFDIGILFDSF